MKRKELEHVLRAASQIVEQRDFLVIGSAAILGTYDDDVLPIHASRDAGGCCAVIEPGLSGAG